ncbi:hypothetical protein Tco_0722626 [Tanacetum coccineum]
MSENEMRPLCNSQCLKKCSGTEGVHFHVNVVALALSLPSQSRSDIGCAGPESTKPVIIRHVITGVTDDRYDEDDDDEVMMMVVMAMRCGEVARGGEWYSGSNRSCDEKKIGTWSDKLTGKTFSATADGGRREESEDISENNNSQNKVITMEELAKTYAIGALMSMGRVSETRLRRQGVKQSGEIDIEFKTVNEHCKSFIFHVTLCSALIIANPCDPILVVLALSLPSQSRSDNCCAGPESTKPVTIR